MDKLLEQLELARRNYAQACVELREAFTKYHKALDHYETTGKPANDCEYDQMDVQFSNGKLTSEAKRN